jgi:hypothetical protein
MAMAGSAVTPLEKKAMAMDVIAPVLMIAFYNLYTSNEHQGLPKTGRFEITCWNP